MTYTLTSLKGIKNIIIYINGSILTNYKVSKEPLIMPLDRSIGINKVYDIIDTDNIRSVTSYFASEYNDNFYYVPVTKYTNDSREKITIIIDELNSISSYATNLMSFINQDVKLLSVLEKDETLEINFNEAILNIDNVILDEVIYTVLYSVEDNYQVKNVVFLIENKKFVKKVL